MFVVKMNPTGTALLYSVFFGGQFSDVAGGIAVDTAGNAYITGSTNSNNFPITVNPPQNTFYGNCSDPQCVCDRGECRGNRAGLLHISGWQWQFLGARHRGRSIPEMHT